MHAETTELIARWLNGPRGVNHYLQHVPVEDGQLSPQPIVQAVSGYSDAVLANTNDIASVFPQVIVDAVQNVTVTGDGPGNLLEGDIAVDIFAYIQVSDLSLGVWQLSALERAISRSLRELEFSRDVDTRPFRTLNGVRIMALKSSELFPPYTTSTPNVLASASRHVFTVREVQ